MFANFSQAHLTFFSCAIHFSWGEKSFRISRNVIRIFLFNDLKVIVELSHKLRKIYLANSDCCFNAITVPSLTGGVAEKSKIPDGY